MLKTRTGEFPVGFRQRFPSSIEWAAANGFGVVDLTGAVTEAVSSVRETGLRIGAIDLPRWREMITVDRTRRASAVSAVKDFIRACANGEPLNFMTIMLPENPDLARRENFDYMLAAYGELTDVLQECNGRIVIEGWPGPGALCCTPEGYRAFFQQCPSDQVGVNYDPSHLIRMGIDPLRFLREFITKVFHVHAKDTDVSQERVYEFGHETPATFAAAPAYGQWAWRYTIPGHGQMRWTDAFGILAQHGYAGCVSIELEDADFTGSEELEKQGLALGGAYLAGC